MSGISILKHILQILENDTILIQMIGKHKIFPIVAENDVTTPFVIMKKQNLEITYTKDIHNDEATITLKIVSINYFTAVDIAERIRLLLENKKNDYFKLIRLENCTEDFLGDNYLLELSFNCFIK